MNPTSRILKILTQSRLPAGGLPLAGTALAIDQPPQEPRRSSGHGSSGIWSPTWKPSARSTAATLAKVPGIVNALTDDQVALLAQYLLPDPRARPSRMPVSTPCSSRATPTSRSTRRRRRSPTC